MVAFGAVLGAVHLAHSLRQHHVLPSGASYLALVTIGAGEKQVKPTAALLVHDADLNTSTLYTIPPDLLLTEPGGEYVMAGDVLAEGQLKQYLERLVGAPISYSLDLSYGDLVKLSGGGDLRVTAAPPFSLQAGQVVRLYSGQFSLPASDLPLLLSANGKGTTDQANAQDALLSAVFAGAALAPGGQRTPDRQGDRRPAEGAGPRRRARSARHDGLERHERDAPALERPDRRRPVRLAARPHGDHRPDHPQRARLQCPLHGRRQERLGRPGHRQSRGQAPGRPRRQSADGANADSFDYSVTQILAGAKAFGVANQVRGILGRGVVLTGSGLPDNTIVVIVGKDLTAKDLQ